MTTVYQYSNSRKSKGLFSHRGSRQKRKWQCWMNEAGECLGHIKLAIFLMAPAVVMLVSCLALFGRNISMNYKIYNLKNEISAAQEELDVLTEASASLASSQKIEEWAEENGFVKINCISYVDLSNENLAQR